MGFYRKSAELVELATLTSLRDKGRTALQENYRISRVLIAASSLGDKLVFSI